MGKYKSLSRAEKIQYATENLSPETIISYQNAIGRSICPIFVPVPKQKPDFTSWLGTAGREKVPTEITVTPIRSDPGKFIVGIIREDGVHISSFKLTKKKLIKIGQNNFWVLQKRDIKER